MYSTADERNDEFGLIGRCGLFCGSCAIYAVSHEPMLEPKRRRMAERFTCAAEAVTCEGCQALTAKCWGRDCKIVACLDGRGVVYCDECADVGTCDLFAEINGRYGGIPRRNLARRRDIGDEAWLAEQRVERACGRCGRPLIYGDDDCAYCGATRAA